MRAWVLHVYSALSLAGFLAAIWYAGPLVSVAGMQPLGSSIVRAIIIAALVLLAATYRIARAWQARRAEQALELAARRTDEVGNDAPVLVARMGEAIATLKRSSGRRNVLYEVPWYVIIGPPGAGKTTALLNSALRFPFAETGASDPVAGVGGTRNCDWWFAEDAVLMDTAGRFTTQESNRIEDAKGWLSFLALLKQNRPRQPINGVIVAISIADLMSLPREGMALRAAEIRDRLRELRDTLRIEFPVYTLFTKADLVVGFEDFFGALDQDGRRKVWGATFQSLDRALNTAGSAPAEFDELAARLTEMTPDRLQEIGDTVARNAAFAFAAQFAALRERVLQFLGEVFDPTVGNPYAHLRGFYFSSGTQEGTPIDQLLGAMGRTLGRKAEPHLSGTGKSFFLHDLFKHVIFAEAGWSTFDPSADRRTRLFRGLGLATIALATVAALGVMGLSFWSNQTLITATAGALDQYRTNAGKTAGEMMISDSDLGNVLSGLDALRDLPAGYASRAMPTPQLEMFGLSQRPRLVSAATTAYREALERGFRSRLLLQLEQTIRARMADPGGLYGPLKIYLMLGGKAPRSDDDMIISWLTQDWQQNRYPGASNRAGRADLEDHLRAMLALDGDVAPTYELDKSLIESAQRSLSRMTIADRATALMQADAETAALEDFSVVKRGGLQASLVFDTTDGSDLAKMVVPGIYTYEGFNRVYMPELARIAQKLTDDQWLIGADPGREGGGTDLLRLGPELLDRYGKDFAAAWNGVLDKLKFKPLAANKQYVALSAAASPDSPLRHLFEAVAQETAITRVPTPDEAERFASATGSALSDEDMAKGLGRIGIDYATGKSQNRAGGAFARMANQAPGAAIEAPFRLYQTLVASGQGQRPIDALVQNFHDIYQSLLLAAQAPQQGERISANLQLQISALQTNASRLPTALARMVNAAADDFEGNVAEVSIAQLNQSLANQVAASCQKVIADRYPFAATSSSDVPLADFTALFGPNGIFDRYFAQSLARFVDVSAQGWTWKQETRLGRELSQSSLKQFQRAATIRDAFFSAGSAAPSLTMVVAPFSLNANADTAMLTVGGQSVQSLRAGGSPSTLTWPSGNGGASLALTPQMSGRDSSVAFDGPWAFKRLLDMATITPKDDKQEVRFVIGGRDVTYVMQAGAGGAAFAFATLADFSCPSTF
ncbi:type VI secretion system membrane subunit TssM [Mesorhizobium sp. BR1-1-16]|uniref:type VI secretion system membrane subunit TssM n=1 Tax=Mesorhizobium sp. BR1-1-16 TaxID=2876653 RepID=UPI001CC96E47|nr:type VI secretion system membrane subunit TssM [Mesorhizobium sp. BR1-1-16]MBZ9938982.1 type VI secretion system membrane subunit TssM [Mesorhizobium sp. BR1-1-16]